MRDFLEQSDLFPAQLSIPIEDRAHFHFSTIRTRCTELKIQTILAAKQESLGLSAELPSEQDAESMVRRAHAAATLWRAASTPVVVAARRSIDQSSRARPVSIRRVRMDHPSVLRLQ